MYLESYVWFAQDLVVFMMRKEILYESIEHQKKHLEILGYWGEWGSAFTDRYEIGYN